MIVSGQWDAGVFYAADTQHSELAEAHLMMREFVDRFAKSTEYFYDLGDFFEKTGLTESLVDASSYAHNMLTLLEWNQKNITAEVYDAYTTVIGLCVAYFEPEVFLDWQVTLLDLSEPDDWFSAQFV
jgi:hypothetical protein